MSSVAESGSPSATFGAHISGAKNDAWVTANANNPLRDGVDDDEDFGERACKIYAKAYREADKAKAKRDAKKALTRFVMALNRLDDRCGGPIDTLRREQALEAYGDGTSTRTADAPDHFLPPGLWPALHYMTRTSWRRRETTYGWPNAWAGGTSGRRPPSGGVSRLGSVSSRAA